MELQELIDNDLAKSGLSSEDMLIKDLDDSAMRACKLSDNKGYIIPYFTLDSKPLGFYRIKLFTEGPKYRQVKGTPSHVYFPLGFMEAFKAVNRKYIIITEGEKKAAAACKKGFPTIAFGGVDSWRSKILVLPSDTDFYSHEGTIHAKLNGDTPRILGLATAPVAVGFNDIVEMLMECKAHVFICYDRDVNDTPTGLKFQVQRAAAELGFELRTRGIEFERIRQLCFPVNAANVKVGIDDYLMQNTVEDFQALIDANLEAPSAFPVHPDVCGAVRNVLSRTKIPRDVAQKLALLILSDLDARGKRMHCKEEEQLYYFDAYNRRLINADLGSKGGERLSVTAFSKHLYHVYGIASNSDDTVIRWLSMVFAAEGNIEQVSPERIIAPTTTDKCVIQLSDSYFAEISSEGLELRQNGANGTLFVADQVSECDALAVKAHYDRLQQLPLKCWWLDVLQEVRLKDRERAAQIHALLYYLSPWLIRWNGMQLPVEIITGEAGSGKSTLCELRLNIISGKPKLRNTPNELKDWQASVANAGGLHITDNIQFTDKQFKQRLSDELCRIVTDPNPQIETRKLYSNAGLYTIPIKCVFGFTGITNPFTANDLSQRSILLELDKSTAIDSNKAIYYDGNWKQNKLNAYGGREAWLAHHALVLQAFFKLYKTEWVVDYRATCRLIHFEQALILMAKVFGFAYDWIPGYLHSFSGVNIIRGDWALEGLQLLCDSIREYIKHIETNTEKDMPAYIRTLPQELNTSKDYLKQGLISSTQIAAWAECHEDYNSCTILTRARSLGKYLQANKTTVLQTCRLDDAGMTYANKKLYKVFC